MHRTHVYGCSALRRSCSLRPLNVEMPGASSQEAERGVLPEPPGFLPGPQRELKRSQWVENFKKTLEYCEAWEFTQATEAHMPAEPDVNLSKRRWDTAREQWTDAVRHLARVARQTQFQQSLWLQQQMLW